MTSNPQPADLPPDRFPLQPLVDLAQPASLTALADRIGVEPRTIYRWRKTGLTVHQADWAAIALTCHPALIWPDRWLTLDLTGAHA